MRNQKQTFILIIVHFEPEERDAVCPFIMSPPQLGSEAGKVVQLKLTQKHRKPNGH